MPNVKGLDPAPILARTLRQGTWTPYGPHTMVALDGSTLTMVNLNRDPLIELHMADTQPLSKYFLRFIDGDTVTAVNALVKPYGKFKQYWRTEEYRWHGVDGYVSPVKGKPVTPAATFVAAPAAPAVPETRETVRITVQPDGSKGVTVEEIVPPAEVEVEVTSQPNAAPVVAVVHQATSTVIETVKRWQDRGGKHIPVSKAITKTFHTVDDVLVPTTDVRVLDSMKRQRDAGRPAFALITGPAGTAKTRLAQAWAFTHDLPVVIVEGQSIQTASDWYGSLVPDVGSSSGWKWEWSDAAKLILTGQPCLVVIDELNRPENERALNGIMGLMDWKATAKPVSAPHAITLKPGQCLIATLNEGPEYVGTVEVDAAVRDRFGLGVRMAYTPERVEVRILRQQVKGLDEDVAKRLVRVAHLQRNKRDDDTLYPSHNVISTRVLIDIAAGIVIGGLEPKEALWGAIRARFIPEDEAALGALIEGQFGADPEVLVDDSLVDDDDIEQMLAAVD